MNAQAATSPEPHPVDARRALKDRNEETFAREFAENRLVLEARPIQVDFETTSRCNIRCFTCPKTYVKDVGRDASRELFDKVADATFATARSINLTGFGEPMMSPHFAHFYERSIEAGLDVGFVTNGTYFNEAWMERFSGDPVHLFLSVDAADAATMKVMRPHIDFEKFRASLRLYRELRERAGAGHRARLYFQFVPTLHNIDALPAVIDWAAEVGAVRMEVFNFRTDELDDHAREFDVRHDPDRTRRAFARARERAEAHGMPLALPSGYEGEVDPFAAGEVADTIDAPVRANPPGSKYPLACSAPWFRINVYQTGDIRPCCWYRWAMGNLNEASFEQIWNGEKYRHMRRKINSRFPQLGCKDCVMTWGITAGRPDLVYAQESLLDRTHTFAQRLRRRLDDWRDARHG